MDQRRRAPRPEGSSRDAFVRSAGRLLRRQGYDATGLNEIVAESGAPKGSLYFHFPGGKESLAVAALEREGELLRAAIASLLWSSEDLGEALASLLDALAAGLARSGFEDGCPLATVALEQANRSPAVRAAAAGGFAAWLGEIERRLVAAGIDPAGAQRKALVVLAALEGALVLARARRDTAPLAAVREELRALVD